MAHHLCKRFGRFYEQTREPVAGLLNQLLVIRPFCREFFSSVFQPPVYRDVINPMYNVALKKARFDLFVTHVYQEMLILYTAFCKFYLINFSY